MLVRDLLFLEFSLVYLNIFNQKFEITVCSIKCMDIKRLELV